MIFDIQRFSIHDGGGIRTLIFFKGCPLRCKWCDNPEGLSFDYDIMYDKRKCIGSLICLKKSINGEITKNDGEIYIHRKKITYPLKFKDTCPSRALTIIGEDKSVDEVIDEVKKDMIFYKKSGGGVTLTGGEPFSQMGLLFKLLKRLKELKIHTAVETSLYTSWKNIEKCLNYIDVFLADFKHTDEKKFKDYTGGRLSLILDNFKRLEGVNAKLTVRIPVVPGFNNTREEMEKIINLASQLKNVKEINFIPLHKLGINKYESLSMKCDFSIDTIPQQDELDGYMQMVKERGLIANIGG